ncbi:MAG: class Ib ribonucleoside-diphosphate reductase assembly flavoprotein NrdI [Bacteroidota bacterium]
MSINIVYFSNYSGNTKRFVEKVAHGASAVTRIPIHWDNDNPVVVADKYVLFVPTYGGGSERSAIPRQVRNFLNIPENRELLVGIVGFGNTNFGEHYCKAAEMISGKTGVPIIARVEIFGTSEDVAKVEERLEKLNG